MHLISHRGNLNGKDPKLENTPLYIKSAIRKGFEVEVDVWLKNNNWFLGHDRPEYKIDEAWLFLNSKRLWCHAKNIDAFYRLIILGRNKTFYHQTDDVTLTTGKYLWTYPGKRPLTNISIAVLPENTDWSTEELVQCAGICSDYIEKFEVHNG